MTTRILRRVTAISIGLFAISVLGWILFGAHIDEPALPITREKAQTFIDFTLPPEASNIRACSYSQWQAYGTYLRFEAPTEVCEAFAMSVTAAKELEPVDEFALAADVRSLHRERFHDVSWFDLLSAKHVVSAGGGPSIPRVWVDVDRGVFYYRMTD